MKSFLFRLIHLPLHIQIFIALIAGSTIGVLFRLFPADPAGFWFDPMTWFADGSVTLGQVFLRLLRMVIVPLVATSIVSGVASAGDPKNLGRLGLKTFAFYMASSTAAIFVGLSLSNIIKPGVGVDIGEGSGISADDLERPGSLGDILMRIIPQNPVNSLVEADMLSIIFFSLCFGAALTRVGEPYRERVLGPIDGIFHVMMKLTGGVIRLAPLGVYGLIFRAVTTMDLEFFAAIGGYMITIAVGLSLHLFLVLPLFLLFLTKRSPKHHFKCMIDALLTAFSTSSSSATLPVTIDCVEHKVGVSNSITSFVLPLGSTVNMDGTALYECAGVLFIAQVMGIHLDLSQQILMVLTALLASIGAAGVPSAGLVMIFIVLDAVGLRGEQVGLIVGTMLAVDRPLDMYRTVVNIYSDSIAATVVGHSEGQIGDPREADAL
ncbi:MAG: dicarboxylate/amino acid:cation symporter [Acidobacteriota bacterium]|nr:dicarboxylate/amino acid:cation symporter [Acidobacteriota bacterium]